MIGFNGNGRNGNSLEKEASKVCDLMEKAKNSDIYSCFPYLQEFVSIVEKSPHKEIYDASDASKIILEKIYKKTENAENLQNALEEIISGNDEYNQIDQKLANFNLTPETIAKYCISKKLQKFVDKANEYANTIIDMDKKDMYNLEQIENYEKSVSDFSKTADSLNALNYGITFEEFAKSFNPAEIDALGVKARKDKLTRLIDNKPEILARDEVRIFYEDHKAKIMSKSAAEDPFFENLDKKYVEKISEFAEIALKTQDRLYENALKQAKKRGQKSAVLFSSGSDVSLIEKEEKAFEGAVSAFIRYSKNYMALLEETEDNLKNCIQKFDDIHRESYAKAMKVIS